MLKMKEALDFCGPMNEVGNDFMKHLTEIRQPNGEITGMEKEIFKWAFECKKIISFGFFISEKKNLWMDEEKFFCSS